MLCTALPLSFTPWFPATSKSKYDNGWKSYTHRRSFVPWKEKEREKEKETDFPQRIPHGLSLLQL